MNTQIWIFVNGQNNSPTLKLFSKKDLCTPAFFYTSWNSKKIMISLKESRKFSCTKKLGVIPSKPKNWIYEIFCHTCIESALPNLRNWHLGGGSTAVSKEGTLFMRGPLNKKKEIYIWMHPLLDLILYQSAARIKMCRILNAA